VEDLNFLSTFGAVFSPRKLCRVNLEADEHPMPILPVYLLQEILLERSRRVLRLRRSNCDSAVTDDAAELEAILHFSQRKLT
jgi:hypothetical protein